MLKKSLSIIMCVLLALALFAGCGKKETAAPAAPAENTQQTTETKKIKVGFSNASVSNTWRVGMLDALKKEVANHPEIELLVTDANDNTAKQITDVDDLLTKGIDMLLISPATADAVNPAIEKAFDKGIPVVVFDRECTTDKITSFVETSDYELGKTSAKRMVELLTKKNGSAKGNIVIIQGFMGSGPQINRQKGFDEVLAQYPDIKVVGNQAADFQRSKGMQVMENFLQANKQIDGILSQSGESLCGAIDAVDAAKRGDGMIYVGVDGYNGLLKLIKSGKVDSTVLLPVRISAESLNVGLKALKGEKVDKKVELEVIQVTKDNVDKYLDANADDGAWTY